MSCPVRLYPLRKPKNHRVPIPRWQLALAKTVTHVFTTYIGVQMRSEDEASTRARAHVSSAIRSWLRADHGPGASESFTMIDGAEKADSFIWVCYWLDSAKYHQALKHLSLATLFSGLEEKGRGSMGIWRESFATAIPRLETNYSGLDYLPGLARLPGAGTEEHSLSAYWGAARDRIPDPSHDLFPKTPHATLPRTVPTGLGQHLIGTNQHNLVHIRSGQFWENCGQQEADAYERKLEPTLHEGLQYLWEHPKETEAMGVRYLKNEDDAPSSGRPRKETCGTAFFSSLDRLEHWAKTHPSHLAIYRGALTHYKAFGDARLLRTWHEVSILREGDAVFEYINCTPGTGVIQTVELEVKSSWDDGMSNGEGMTQAHTRTSVAF
ncbi:phenylacetaldoxime dehydratase [Ilyonectria robusta]|uniref:phenylacetaldoxime dehydratase n=1 Tax=Ilyonectria robusta TaxID=1079257 RepID=UPI001E8CCCBA|nr:phenylacetaldoxime dehydratase [Ilyonectria robusta]KAH8654792.1 phenylacetaldoxime dehydratase [Ilyonectria robusta]